MEEIEKLIASIEKLIPEFMLDPADKNISNGNVAVCIIDENNNIFGKLFGTDKNRSRQSFKVAWTKASQVWITGYKTGEYETLVFTNQIDEYKFGISRPDMIGWEGGQPIVLKNGSKISVGFSGFRGINDLEIVVKAVKQANL
jgi:glc operon protein GlcG